MRAKAAAWLACWIGTDGLGWAEPSAKPAEATPVEAASATSDPSHIYVTPEGRRSLQGFALNDRVSIDGLIEAEASAGQEQGESVSDLVLATFQLGLQADIAPRLRGRAILLWEEDETEPIDLDEAFLSYELEDIEGLSLRAGRMYVPFGHFNSHFISDPLTLELGETRESAALVEFTHGRWTASAAAFRGDAEPDRDQIADGVLSLACEAGEGLSLGASWISDLGETDALQDRLASRREEAGELEHDRVPGAHAYVQWDRGPLLFDFEYLAALDDFSAGALDEDARRPAAWNAEVGFLIPRVDIEIALKAEGAEDHPEFPERQYGAALSRRVTEQMTVSVEYLDGRYDDGTKRHMATMQWAVEF